MVVLLDGGFSSQVEKYVDEKFITNSPLWCSHLLTSNPEAVVKTHTDYINAGCEVVSTNTYQASITGFQEHLGLNYDESVSLIKRGGHLVQEAINNSSKKRKVLIAGSIGPYGACLHDGSEYTGSYADSVSPEELRDWHRPRIKALVEERVDLLAIETQPVLAEALTVLQLLKNEFPQQKAWVSFQCKDEKHISHGENFKDAVHQCYQLAGDQLVAVGVNCLSPSLVTPLLTSAKELNVPFIVYPNGGGIFEAGVGWTNEEACVPLSQYLSEWVSLGAKYVGGCCRTRADDIGRCREYIDCNHL